VNPILPLAWLAFAVCELALSGPLRHPPSLAGAALELGALGLLGLLHARAAVPGTLLASPTLPGALLALCWLVAAAVSPSPAVEGGGGPASGGGLAAMAALWTIAAAALLARRVPWAEGREPAALAVGSAGLGALLGLLCATWADPTCFPSPATLPLLGAALLRWLGATLGLAVLASWRPSWAPPAAVGLGLALSWQPRLDPGPPGPLLLLVTVDTLRADVAQQMPSVRALAARGERFVDASSTAAWTVPAMGSVMTGQWPATHGAGRHGLAWPGLVPLDAALPTLAERLQGEGWRTVAAVSNSFLVPVLGFDRGFDTFLHSDARPDGFLLVPWLAGHHADLAPRFLHRNDARELVTDALALWERQGSAPTFLWIHLLDPHLPYHHAVLTPEDPLRLSVGRIGELDATDIRRGELRDVPEVRQAVRERYEAEVAWADQALSALFERVLARADHARTTVILTADHGEELWEHGGFEHGHAMWPEITQVPLVLVRPGGPQGASRAEPASLVDVAPTLLAAAGLPVPEGPGLDLARPVPSERVRRLQGTLYFRQQQAVLRGPYALVEIEGEGQRLYDRAADPTWSQDLQQSLPAELAELQRLLEPDWERPWLGQGPLELDQEALKALGYLD
jgi:arylsulfatase A-like enzyme